MAVRAEIFWLQFALLETMMTAVQDTFPQLRAKKTYVVAFVCFIGFLGGLSVTCNVSHTPTILTTSTMSQANHLGLIFISNVILFCSTKLCIILGTVIIGQVYVLTLYCQ